VLHRGYLEFFRRHSKTASQLWLVGADLAAEFFTFHTEIRAIDPLLIKRMIISLDIFSDIIILNANTISRKISVEKMITASENVSREVTKKYFPNTEIVVDTVFLRYDESNVKTLKPVIYDRISTDPFDQQMMRLAFNEAEKSSDWWRHVGAVLLKNRKIIATGYNHPVPSEHIPYVLGNPRDFIEAGTLSLFSDAMHGEISVFAQVLIKGVSTKDCDLYVTSFCCPGCSKMVAYSGIKRLFFGSGHASLDGQEVLQSQNVELIYVPL